MSAPPIRVLQRGLLGPAVAETTAKAARAAIAAEAIAEVAERAATAAIAAEAVAEVVARAARAAIAEAVAEAVAKAARAAIAAEAIAEVAARAATAAIAAVARVEAVAIVAIAAIAAVARVEAVAIVAIAAEAKAENSLLIKENFAETQVPRSTPRTERRPVSSTGLQDGSMNPDVVSRGSPAGSGQSSCDVRTIRKAVFARERCAENRGFQLAHAAVGGGAGRSSGSGKEHRPTSAWASGRVWVWPRSH
jgi:hypothetical protein